MRIPRKVQDEIAARFCKQDEIAARFCKYDSLAISAFEVLGAHPKLSDCLVPASCRNSGQATYNRYSVIGETAVRQVLRRELSRDRAKTKTKGAKRS